MQQLIFRNERFWEFVSRKGRIICTFAKIFADLADSGNSCPEKAEKSAFLHGFFQKRHILGIRVRKRQKNLHFCQGYSKNVIFWEFGSGKRRKI
jgi:hypothetical protein